MVPGFGYKVFCFKGLYHGKSPFKSPIWENMFDFFHASNKQIQEKGRIQTALGRGVVFQQIT